MSAYRLTEQDLALMQERLQKDRPSEKGKQSSSAYQTNKHEQQEQIWFMDWCKLQTLQLVEPDGRILEMTMFEQMVGYPGGAMLQGDSKKRAMHWSYLKRTGCKKDVSDLQFNWPLNGYHGMCIEMKKRRDQFRCSSDIANAATAGQVAYLTRMRRLGWFTCIPFGWVEAAKATCKYLNWDPAERGL